MQYQLVKEERDYIKSLQLICEQSLPFLLSHPTCFCSLVKLYMRQYNLEKLKKFFNQLLKFRQIKCHGPIYVTGGLAYTNCMKLKTSERCIHTYMHPRTLKNMKLNDESQAARFVCVLIHLCPDAFPSWFIHLGANLPN